MVKIISLVVLMTASINAMQKAAVAEPESLIAKNSADKWKGLLLPIKINDTTIVMMDLEEEETLTFGRFGNLIEAAVSARTFYRIAVIEEDGHHFLYDGNSVERIATSGNRINPETGSSLDKCKVTYKDICSFDGMKRKTPTSALSVAASSPPQPLSTVVEQPQLILFEEPCNDILDLSKMDPIYNKPFQRMIHRALSKFPVYLITAIKGDSENITYCDAIWFNKLVNSAQNWDHLFNPWTGERINLKNVYYFEVMKDRQNGYKTRFIGTLQGTLKGTSSSFWTSYFHAVQAAPGDNSQLSIAIEAMRKHDAALAEPMLRAYLYGKFLTILEKDRIARLLSSPEDAEQLLLQVARIFNHNPQLYIYGNLWQQIFTQMKASPSTNASEPNALSTSAASSSLPVKAATTSALSVSPILGNSSEEPRVISIQLGEPFNDTLALSAIADFDNESFAQIIHRKLSRFPIYLLAVWKRKGIAYYVSAEKLNRTAASLEIEDPIRVHYFEIMKDRQHGYKARFIGTMAETVCGENTQFWINYFKAARENPGHESQLSTAIEALRAENPELAEPLLRAYLYGKMEIACLLSNPEDAEQALYGEKKDPQARRILEENQVAKFYADLWREAFKMRTSHKEDAGGKKSTNWAAEAAAAK